MPPPTLTPKLFRLTSTKSPKSATFCRSRPIPPARYGRKPLPLPPTTRLPIRVVTPFDPKTSAPSSALGSKKLGMVEKSASKPSIEPSHITEPPYVVRVSNDTRVDSAPLLPPQFQPT